MRPAPRARAPQINNQLSFYVLLYADPGSLALGKSVSPYLCALLLQLTGQIINRLQWVRGLERPAEALAHARSRTSALATSAVAASALAASAFANQRACSRRRGEACTP